MSTRCNIVLKDMFGHEMIFYRHSDGYPEGVAPTLNKFMEWLREGRIRDNTSQAGGWLIILGAAEYNYKCGDNFGEQIPLHTPLSAYIPDSTQAGCGWKVGAYEPTTAIHGDIEYLYEINLQTGTLKGWEYRNKKGKPVKIPAIAEAA